MYVKKNIKEEGGGGEGEKRGKTKERRNKESNINILYFYFPESFPPTDAFNYYIDNYLTLPLHEWHAEMCPGVVNELPDPQRGLPEYCTCLGYERRRGEELERMSGDKEKRLKLR
jgi:hypothetical protein